MTAEKVLYFFRQIARIPRESGHEEKIVAFLKQFAADRNLECHVDKVGNVVIAKPATKGREGKPALVIQCHTDMVCEKIDGSSFDFATDPIKIEEKDGWMFASETTLGADNGIGVASCLSILDDDTLEHPRLECLFTVSEENGLIGAHNLKPNFITGRTLINVDDEDDGCFCVGCAGGADTVGTFTYSAKKVAAGMVTSRFSISGGIGGHSGDDIGKHRINSIQLLARFVDEAFGYGVDLCSFTGGGKRNAITRSGEVVLAIPSRKEDQVVALFNKWASEVKAEYETAEPDICFSAEPVTSVNSAIDRGTAGRLVRALLTVPHGVIEMSPDIPDLVETSSNLASVKMVGRNRIVVGTMQRSSVNSAKEYLIRRVSAAFRQAGAVVKIDSGYSGWRPNINSHIKDVCVSVYQRMFGKDPVVHAIHAGLECGLFTEKFPGMDMIAFGPTIRSVHAPGERLDLASLDRFYAVLCEVIRTF